MFDFTLYDLQDLFKVRDALIILAGYELENKDMLFEVNKEIQEKTRKEAI